jgi:hypothetical protein
MDLVPTPRNASRRTAGAGLTLLAAAAFLANAGCDSLLARARAHRAESEVQKIFENNPSYKKIAQFDPTVADQMKAAVKDSAAKGESHDVAVGKARGVITGLVAKHVPRASDEAVVGYVSVFMTELDQLAAAGPEVCYGALFPNPASPVNIAKHLDQPTQEADLAALAEVVRTSSESPQQPASEKQLGTVMVQVIQRMGTQHGRDVELLDRLQDPTIDKKKACALVRSLYGNILELPKATSGPVLRAMFSGQ